tara:strand:- start:3134 stop:3367 length:234 start_codon:yes stop_codon:yes gene_type:complete
MINSDLKSEPVKIWGVISGPFEVDHPEIDIIYYNLCKVEVDGRIGNMEYFFDSFNDAYDMVKHFQTSIDPIEIETED